MTTKVFFSLCCFLAISCSGLGKSVGPIFSHVELWSIYEEECTDGQHHYHWYPYDCQKYYSCQNGTLEVKTCPTDMNWNEAIKACDVKEHTDCSNIIPYPNPNCSYGDGFSYYPYDCQKFYECLNGTLYLLTCPEDSLWNDKEKKCDESDDVDCSVIPNPNSTTTAITPNPNSTTTAITANPDYTTTAITPNPIYTTTGPTTAKTPTVPPKVECTNENQFFPYPYNCSKYYECDNFVAVLMDCPPGEYWHDEIKSCDWAYNVDCVASSSPAPSTIPANTTTSSTDPTDIPDVECTNENQYFPYPYNCSMYYECDNFIAVLMDCPPGEYWHDEIKNCDWAYNVDCSASIPPSKYFE